MERHPRIFNKVLRELVQESNSNLFFTNIQKTGGISINEAIGKHFRRCDHSRIFAAPSYKTAKVLAQKSTEKSVRNHVWTIRKYLVAYEMAKSAKYISGHVPFNQQIRNKFHTNYIYLTILRNPIDRFISKYFHNAFKESNHLKTRENLQHIINSDLEKDWGCEYVRLISGWIDIDDCTSTKAIQKAKEDQSKFNVIIFLENLDIFVQDFHQASGIRLRIPHKRGNPISNPNLDNSTIRCIEKLCQPDIEIYKYAKDKFLEHTRIV